MDLSKNKCSAHLMSKMGLIVLMMAGSLVTAWAAPVVGTSAAVRGKVFVSTSGAERKAQVKDSIKLQDKVRTRNDSALQILLLDESTFTVGQNCEMVIDRFVYDPSTSVGQVSASIAKGAFRFMSGRIGKQNPTNANLSTPSATIGIRGTFLDGVVGEDAIILADLAGLDTSNADPEKASIVVLRGPGRGGTSLDNPGRITVSTGGGTATISQPNYAIFTPAPGLPPIGPFLITPQIQQYLDLFLRSSPNGATQNPTGESETGSKFSGQEKFEGDPEGTTGLIDDIADGITDPLINTDEPLDPCIVDPYSYSCSF